MSKPALFLIGGPTASGKSAAAIELARKENGVIINADAMQLYSGLPILTAQPSKQEMSATPHELYAIADATERFSVGKWLTLAHDSIKRAAKANLTPILVGGTGLYFKALTEGLAEIPEIPENLRNDVQELYAAIGSESFRQKLAALDPTSAEKIKPNDKQRLIRAYEVALHTGKPIGFWQNPTFKNHSLQNSASFRRRPESSPYAIAQGGNLSDKLQTFDNTDGLDSGLRRNDVPVENLFTIKKILIIPPRDELYAACDRRFENMMKNGAINEVKKLLERNLPPDLPAMKILGVREIAAYLRKEISLEEATTKAQQSTRNYAKRQMTWFRNQWNQRTEDRDQGSE